MSKEDISEETNTNINNESASSKKSKDISLETGWIGLIIARHRYM